MRFVGRVLRMLRIASRLAVEEAAIASVVLADRLRDLEGGVAEVGYLEAIHLAKTYMLCPTCFKRHVEAAVDRDLALSIYPTDVVNASAEESGSLHAGAGVSWSTRTAGMPDAPTAATDSS